MANAILMAAGLGTRLRPLTDTMPKPLLKIGNEPMIETVLRALQEVSVRKIYLLVGFLGKQFDYLQKKYHNLEIIINPDFQTVNNISSIYYAADKLLESDNFICEADLFIQDSHILKQNLSSSGYFGAMIKGYSSDWVFDLDRNGRITRVGRGGKDQYNMVGLSYFTAEDSKILSCIVKNAYKQPGYETLFWDEIVNKNLDKLKLKIYPVSKNQIVEIDTIEEFNKINEEVSRGSKRIS